MGKSKLAVLTDIQRKARQLRNKSRNNAIYKARQFESEFLLFTYYSAFIQTVNEYRKDNLNLSFRHFLTLLSIKYYLVDTCQDHFQMIDIKKFINRSFTNILSIKATQLLLSDLYTYGFLGDNPLGYVLTMKARAFFRSFDSKVKQSLPTKSVNNTESL